MAKNRSNNLALRNLRKHWILTLLFVLVFVGTGFLLLRNYWSPIYALRWLGLSSALSAWQLLVLWRALPENHRGGEDNLLPVLGWGNLLSFLRGIFVAALLGFLLSPWPDGRLAWLPFAFYLFAALSDFLDGYLARITNHVTQLGATLDMNNDSWGVLIVTILVFWYGRVPVWYLPVGLARYIFLAGLWLRERQGKVNLELPHSYRRRIFAGVQMGFIVAMLAPLFSPPATTITATLFMLPFLGGFLYDWLLITGQIDSDKGAVFFENLAASAWMRWIPFGLRLLAASALSYTVFTQPVDVFAAYGLALGSLWEITQAIIVLMLLFGAVGRLAAALMLIFTGLTLQFVILTPLYTALLLLGTTVLFTGTGALSLWSPEEWLIYNRAGEISHG